MIGKFIRRYSKTKAAIMRVYNARVKVWKSDKRCVCCGLVDWAGKLICSARAHMCEDNHHQRGTIGALLMDERWWTPVCRQSHNWIKDHPANARALGLLPVYGTFNEQVKEACTIEQEHI